MAPSALRLIVRRRGRDGQPLEFSLAVPSDLACVGDAVELVAHQCRTGPLSVRRLAFNLRTALAEALTNAITYGSRLDPAKAVHVRVEVTVQAVRIDVQDAGDGFDPAGVPDPTVPDNLPKEYGRGLFVLRHLVDEVTFNPKGNVICLTLRAG